MYRELESHDYEMQKERSASRIRELETALEHQKIDAAHVVEKLELKLANVEAMLAMDREMCELKLFKATTL